MSALLGLPAALAGLLVPGYLLARLCRVPDPALSAFPLSVLIICLTTIAQAATSWPITFPTAAAGVAAVAVCCGVALFRRRLRPIAPDQPSTATTSRTSLTPVQWGAAAMIALTVLVLAFRVTLCPLGGFDTLFRWELLARQIFIQQSLQFYPPLTDRDFAIYPIVDAIPPLASIAYWWLYAGLGEPAPAITPPVIWGQFLCAGGLAYAAARNLTSRGGALWTTFLLAATPLFVSNTAIGQETGWTAVAVAGQAACALALRVRPHIGPAIATGLYAGLACLAREYGPALAAVGFVLIVADPRSRRFWPLFVMTTLAVGAPWYVRTWLLTGNPLYSNPLPGLPVNTVHAGILHEYSFALGATKWDFGNALGAAITIFQGAGLLLVAAGAGAWAAGSRSRPWLIGAAIIVLIWLASVGFTSGGSDYSLRVLTPCWVMLAILAAYAVESWTTYAATLPQWVRRAVLLSIGLWSAGGLVTTAAHPYLVGDLPGVFLSQRTDPLEMERFVPLLSLVEVLDESSLPDVGILTDDAYLATVLIRTESRFRPVMIWSPEAALLFDRTASLAECHEMLSRRRIALVAISRGGLNWRYLQRSPFFQADGPAWIRILGTSHGYEIKGMPGVALPKD